MLKKTSIFKLWMQKYKFLKCHLNSKVWLKWSSVVDLVISKISFTNSSNWPAGNSPSTKSISGFSSSHLSFQNRILLPLPITQLCPWNTTSLKPTPIPFHVEDHVFLGVSHDKFWVSPTWYLLHRDLSDRVITSIPLLLSGPYSCP